jgi:aminoglycoside 6'-N-acetyltransferase I
MENWAEVEAIPGAGECLSMLKGFVPLAIATNASASRRPMIERALERVGMRHFFSAIFCFMDVGCRKNQPGFWRAVETGLGIPLARIAMLGDSLEHDVIAPRAFGVQAVWFNRDGRLPAPVEAVPTVTRLAEFAHWVRNAR